MVNVAPKAISRPSSSGARRAVLCISVKGLRGPLAIGISCTLLCLALYFFDSSLGRWMSLIEYRLYDFRMQKSAPC